MYRTLVYFLLIILLHPSLFSSNASDSNCYKSRFFTTNDKLTDTFTAALRKHNICIEFHKVSHSKGKQLMKAGVFDVDFARVLEFNDGIKAPIKHIEPHWTVNKGYLVCQKDIECTKENMTNMRVATLRELIWNKKYFVDKDKVYLVSKGVMLRTLFEKKRVDAILVSGAYLTSKPANLPFPHTMLILEDLKTYIWVQNKHKRLIKALEKSMPEIIASIKEKKARHALRQKTLRQKTLRQKTLRQKTLHQENLDQKSLD